jgi:hypothetical protein
VKYSVVAIKAFNLNLMMCFVHCLSSFIFLEFDWVTLPCAVHLLNYVPTNGGKK